MRSKFKKKIGEVVVCVALSPFTVHCEHKQDWGYGTDLSQLLLFSRCFKTLTFQVILTANKIEQLLIKKQFSISPKLKRKAICHSLIFLPSSFPFSRGTCTAASECSSTEAINPGLLHSTEILSPYNLFSAIAFHWFGWILVWRATV